MVATRRVMRSEPQVATEERGGRGEQNSLKAASPKQTQTTTEKECEAARGGQNIQYQSESEVSTTRTDALKTPAKASTHSRHSSGAKVSDSKYAVSSSSTRVSQSTQSLGGLTATARRLRSCKSVVTEPILKSKEDEVSEAESNCSSVSTRARRTRACVSLPIRSRSRRLALVSELDSDHSEAESYCSSVSGFQNTAASEATSLPSPESKSRREEISETESLSSGFTSQPLIKRSSKRILYKVQTEAAKGSSRMVSGDRMSPMKQKPYLRGVQVTEPCSTGIQQSILSTPRRSMRNRTVSHGSEVRVLSNADSAYKELSNEDLHVEELEDKENKAVEDNTELVPEVPETSQSIKPDTPDQDESDVEMEESHVAFSRKPKNVAANRLQDMAVDGLFVIDTAPGVDSSKKYYIDHEEQNKEPVAEQSEVKALSEPEDNKEDEDFIDEDEEDELLNRPKRGFVLSTSIDTGLSIKEMGGLYISFDAEKPNPGPSLLKKIKQDRKKDELLKKSIITPDFEKKDAVPPYRESLYKLKKMRKEEREKTTGQGWFDMKAPELTQELKNDLKALKMRSAMDPKHFYKKNDREGFPKYFQVATVVDNPADFYHSRIPKKQRKRTIVEELLADSEFRRYNKKKYQEIIAEKMARAEGKKNRKKKKFRS